MVVNKSLITTFCIVALSLFSIPSFAQQFCGSATIDVQLVTLENRNFSNYQFPIFREGDILALESISITNTGNCTIENPYFELTLRDAEGNINDNPFCQRYFNAPINLTEGQSYWQKRINWNEYLDSLNRTDTHCFRELNNIGRWEINGKPADLGQPQNRISSWSFRTNGIFLSPVGFRVHSPLELALFDAAKEANKLAKESNGVAIANYIAALIAVLIALFGIWHSRHLLQKQFGFTEERHQNKQENILRALHFELNGIKKSSEGFDEEIQKNSKSDIDDMVLQYGSYRPMIPIYPIKSINYAYYIRALDNEFRDKTTQQLKETLIALSDKIWMVNDIWKRLKDRIIYHTDTPYYWPKIDKRFKTEGQDHIKEDLNNLIKKALDMLEHDFGIKP
ncbi:MAG: hypothetical protein A3B70_00625 [Deltaproteobacteria bacterium RIFCSPHIGHO2_02_FULL_40_11]|nr:MAG: hypothetical protein A3B70_00625 [Deltaproteobacteria bacterium RIFCSPHIGHO2_02_FULL_40_11]